MRAVWVDAGNDANWDKMQAHKMTAAFYAITDPVPDLKRRISQTIVKNYKPGLYMAWNWPQFQGLDGANVADKMHSMVAAVDMGLDVKVQFDIEAHDPEYISACLARYRALRPTQGVSWTMEGHQGGWMEPDFVKKIKATKTRLVPQCYSADMVKAWDSLEMARDLTKRGFALSMISPFHDAAKLPEWWEGFAFTLGRLP